MSIRELRVASSELRVASSELRVGRARSSEPGSGVGKPPLSCYMRALSTRLRGQATDVQGHTKVTRYYTNKSTGARIGCDGNRTRNPFPEREGVSLSSCYSYGTEQGLI